MHPAGVTCKVPTLLGWIRLILGCLEVKQLQNYVTQLKRAYRVNTELYRTAQLETYYKTYSPYQTRAKLCVRSGTQHST